MEELLLYLVYTASGYVLSKKDVEGTMEKLKGINTNRRYSFCTTDTSKLPIKDLIFKLENNIKAKDRYNLYGNLESLKIEKNYWILLEGCKGKYQSDKNLVLYNFEGSLEHEMVHVASSYSMNENNIQSGFKIFRQNGKEKLVVGQALNEGYTDLFTRRVFDKRVSVYDGICKIAENMESVVGHDKMQSLYFNNDLRGLIRQLQNYMEYKDVIKLILDIDRYFELKLQLNPMCHAFYCDIFDKLDEVKQKRI